MENIHATCVALNGQAVLLQGKSGSGKSDLALRLVDEGWDLVSDDYTDLEIDGSTLFAKAPKTIEGLIEVRGIGILRIGCVPRAELKAIFELVPFEEMERLPDPKTHAIQGYPLPVYTVYGHDASAPTKIRMALRAHAENLFIE